MANHHHRQGREEVCTQWTILYGEDADGFSLQSNLSLLLLRLLACLLASQGPKSTEATEWNYRHREEISHPSVPLVSRPSLETVE